jgi:hypothetical protein
MFFTAVEFSEIVSEFKSTANQKASVERELQERLPFSFGRGTVDLKQYFRKIREIEATINTPHTFVTSLETPDGGKGGIVTEVTREIAAKMIAEGRALLTTNTERETFLAQQETERVQAEKAEAARRVHVTIVSDTQSIRSTLQSAPSESSTSRK